MLAQLHAELAIAEAQYQGLRQAWREDPNDVELECRMERAESRVYDLREQIAAL